MKPCATESNTLDHPTLFLDSKLRHLLSPIVKTSTSPLQSLSKLLGSEIRDYPSSACHTITLASFTINQKYTSTKFSMTSISQPVLAPQAPSTASQPTAPARSPSASASARASSQAAGTASTTAKTSYASATKKTSAPSSASGGTSSSAAVGLSQHGKPDVTSPMNGRIAIPPAIPTVGTAPFVNGNTPTSSTSGPGEHNRKPSVTISAAGTSGSIPNGGPVVGKPKGGRDIQFGALPEGSPKATNAMPQPVQSSNSLAVNTPSNPRVTSPQTSPSPIPQPAASGGGRPPSSLHGNSNSVSFGNFNGPEGNVS